tara:strand:- start:82 stop:918 length:837 start_codon:yes stop_codon:yes gene_type:complete
MNRKEIAELILLKINNETISKLKNKYKSSSSINYLIIDDLLPKNLASQLNSNFPNEYNMSLRSGMQEKKFIAVNWGKENKLLEECLFAFQDKRVIKEISKICLIKDLTGDPELYAGGLSLMNKGCFLNPHIDNSHDRLRERYRRLNLLYYISENWDEKKDGGELVLFPNGLKENSISLPTKFNRLVIMRTDNRSLHGVNLIKSENNSRKCISNYYFSNSSPSGKKYYHSTSFRGFKGEKGKDFLLRINAATRTTLKALTGNFFGRYINTGHHRKKENS